MAKPTKHATEISVVLSIAAAIGILIGILTGYALIPAILLVPTVIYEVYRTEGKSTTAASWLLLGVLALEIIFLAFKISINLVDYLGVEEKLIAGYEVPLGDVKVVAPTIMAILSVILFTRTYGKYTKWLSVIIFITSFAIIFLLDASLFERLFKFALEQGIDSI